MDFDYWKIQGNLGGEDYPDKVRGPLNEGGLFVERQGQLTQLLVLCRALTSGTLVLGAHLPDFPAESVWRQSAACSPLEGLSAAGIHAYRTTFALDLPSDVDTPIALKFTRTPAGSYRSVIYINGWQFGRFSSRDGPQEVFPVRAVLSSTRVMLMYGCSCRKGF
jgi:hypothetical protein